MGETVSVVKFNENSESIKEAVEKCDGFSELRPDDKVFIKPNLVFWDRVYPFPKFGVLTTTILIEEVVKLLREHGCTDISIGEGSMEFKELGSSTKEAFDGLGYNNLREKYGVDLVDFNDGPFTKVDLDGGDISLDVSDHVLNADFIINLPVLKTHSTTKVSLGLKNLKGCIDTRSKMFCHHEKISLDHFISKLGKKISPDLTIIDGIYSLEKGPFINGKAHRTDILVASKDCFGADVVGSELLGFSPEDIFHLKDYRENYNRSFDEIKVTGEDIEDVKTPLEWDWEWLEDNSGPPAFKKLGVGGVYYPKYDNTLCSGCSFLNNAMLILLLDAYQRGPFQDMEFLSGKRMVSEGGYDKTVLLGKCAVNLNKNNSKINEKIEIKGCPPNLSKIASTLKENGIEVKEKAYYQYRKSLLKQYEQDKDKFKEEHF